MTELKPCPFCGSDDLSTSTQGSAVYIECLGCGSQGPYAYMKSHWGDEEYLAEKQEIYKAVIMAWNERAKNV